MCGWHKQHRNKTIERWSTLVFHPLHFATLYFLGERGQTLNIGEVVQSIHHHPLLMAQWPNRAGGVHEGKSTIMLSFHCETSPFTLP